MTYIERLEQAVGKAPNKRGAKRQLLLCIYAVEQSNRAQRLELTVAAVVQRLDDPATKPLSSPDRRGRKPLTSHEAVDLIDIRRASLSMLVNGGRANPSSESDRLKQTDCLFRITSINTVQRNQPLTVTSKSTFNN